MSRFNSTKSPKVHDVVNRAGGRAFAQSPELALASLLLTSFLMDQHYRSAQEQLDAVSDLVSRVDPEFAARAALFARREFGMRSISHAVAVALAPRLGGTKWGKYFYSGIVRRPDDITEIVALLFATNGSRKLPAAMKKGFAFALAGMDEYQLGKYKGEKKDVSMIDVVNLVHPQSTPALDKLMTGTLESPDTWEVKITAAGSADDVSAAKTAAWRDLILNGKLGYFALLRNLRNLETQADAETLATALNMLCDERLIMTSLVLPFRYLSAYKSVANRMTRDALSRAIDISLANVPRLEGNTLVAVDVSGSMTWKNSRGATPIDTAALFAAALYRANDADLVLFDTKRQVIAPDASGSTLGIYQYIQERATGGGTNFNLIFDALRTRYDRVIVLSDMQAWVGGNYGVQRSFKRYVETVGHKPFLYMFDLQGYGDAQYPEDKVFSLAGFSEKVFDLMPALEEGADNLVSRINKVTIMRD